MSIINNYGYKLLLKRDILMELRDLGLSILFVVVIATAFGYSISKYLKEDDTVIEEALEAVTEDVLEGALGLPSDALEGVIDFTPSSPEV